MDELEPCSRIFRTLWGRAPSHVSSSSPYRLYIGAILTAPHQSGLDLGASLAISGLARHRPSNWEKLYFIVRLQMHLSADLAKIPFTACVIKSNGADAWQHVRGSVQSSSGKGGYDTILYLEHHFCDQHFWTLHIDFSATCTRVDHTQLPSITTPQDTDSNIYTQQHMASPM